MSGSVFVQFDKPFYFAGDTVTGTVFLNINNQFPGNSIRLKVKGWETAIWITQQHIMEQQGQQFIVPAGQLMNQDDLTVSEDTSDSSDGKERSRPGYIRKANGQLYKIQRHAGNREFMKTKLDLYTWEGGFIPPGGYSFPFSFMLNPEWPGTFSYKQTDKKARIKYEVKCTCSFPSDKKREFCHRTELVVRERLQDKIKAATKEFTAQVTSCCCCDQGKCKIKVFFEKDALCLGEKVRMTQELDCTQLKVDCTSITANLIQSISYKDNEGQGMSHSISKFGKQFGGLAKGEKIEGQTARFEEFVLENQGSAQRGLSIMPSVNGRLVTSSYSMHVVANLNADCMCCSDVPAVANPVFIYAQDIQPKPFIPPSGWQPQVMPVRTIPIGGNIQNQAGQVPSYNQGPPLMQPGYPPQQGGMPPQQQGGFPPQQGGYPPQQGGYPPQQGGYPPQQGGMPPQQGGYPPQQGGYPPQQGGYPPQQQGYPPQQGGYPPQQGGYPPQQGGFSNEQQMQQTTPDGF